MTTLTKFEHAQKELFKNYAPRCIEEYKMTELTKLEQAEKEVILQSLIDHYFNKSATAKELGISRATLNTKINKYLLMQPKTTHKWRPVK